MYNNLFKQKRIPVTVTHTSGLGFPYIISFHYIMMYIQQEDSKDTEVAAGGKVARVSPERAEPASSTTGAPPPPPAALLPPDWSVEDVIGFIAAADHALAAHADLFRRHVTIFYDLFY